jgi:predicted transcriptional regulator
MVKQQTLTSVKIESELFEEFRILSIKLKTSFKDLAEKAVHRYVNDEEFRRDMNNYRY